MSRNHGLHAVARVLTSQSGTAIEVLPSRLPYRVGGPVTGCPAAAVPIQCDEQSNDPSSGISLLITLPPILHLGCHCTISD